MNDASEATIMLFVVVGLIVFDALQALIIILDKGIYKDEREELMKKSVKELRLMLIGVKRTSRLCKEELIEMLVAA